MKDQKAQITALELEIVELRKGETTIENARALSAKRVELSGLKAEVAEIEAAFAADPEPEAEPQVAEAEVAPVEVLAPVETVVEPVATEAAPVAEAVEVPELALAASGNGPSPTAGGGGTRPEFVLTAAGNLGGVATGQRLDREHVRKMLGATLTAGSHPTGGPVRLFEMNRFAGDVTVPSSSRSAIENTRIIERARKEKQEPLMLTAAACFCGPDEVFDDVDVCGRRGRPVANIFPTIPINGGFRYLQDLSINPDSGSVGIWECTDQDLVDPADPDTWKPCSELDCFTEIDVLPYMIKGCTLVRRQHQWAHPEQVDAWIQKLMIEYDRVAERQLLDLITADAGASLVVGNGTMLTHGLLSQFEYALGSLAFSLGYQFRGDALEGHTVIVPRGFLEAVLTDELIRGFPSGVRTIAEIRSLIRGAYGVTIVERLDESTATAAAAALTVTNLNTGGAIDTAPPYLLPEFWRLYVVKPDQWVHGEGVMVGADWVVDSDLLRQNMMQYFWENVEVLERTGCEKAYIIDVEGCINGGRSDLVLPPDCEA